MQYIEQLDAEHAQFNTARKSNVVDRLLYKASAFFVNIICPAMLCYFAVFTVLYIARHW